MEEIIKERSKFYSEYNIKHQPYAIIAGSLCNVKKAFTVIDSIVYELNNGIEAVDLCFKSYYVFNIEFSFGCPYIWSFLQEYVY